MLVAGHGGAVPPAHRLVDRDVRLHGWRPRGDTIIEVYTDTPILWFITSAASDADQASSVGKRVRLRIMAHGYRGPGNNQGGGGVQFCREDINLATINLSAPLQASLPMASICMLVGSRLLRRVTKAGVETATSSAHG